MTKIKQRSIVFIAVLAAVSSFVTLLPRVFAKAEDVAQEPTAKTEIRVVEELNWEGTPVAGWGEVRKNLHASGGPLVVGGVTYTENGIGTHMPAVYGEQDIVYDVSAYSDEFRYLDLKVAMPDDGGNNNVIFSVLADDKTVDSVHWNCVPDGNHRPMTMRADIAGASKLTLRICGADSVNYSYGNGACAFLDVRLLKDVWDGYMPATRIYDRMENPGVGGWSEGYCDGAAFDTTIAGEPFEYMMYDDKLSYDGGIGVHLKNVSYEAYSADKDNVGNFISLKWNIKGMNFSHFSTLAYAALGTGYHADVWIDGKEVYTSGKIDSIGTYIHYERDARRAPREISVAVPENAEVFELRVIADTVFNDGKINFASPTFFEKSDKLVSIAGVQTASEVLPISSPRSYMYDGRRAQYYDAESDKNIEAPDGLFFLGGTQYVFDVSDVAYNTLTGILGKADFGHMDEPNVTPLELRYTVEDKNGNITTGKTESIDKSTSGKRVSIYMGKDAKTLTLTMYTDNLSFSESVFAAAEFTDAYIVKFDDGDGANSVLYAAGATLTEPQSPTKRGYVFDGWKLKGEESAYDFTDKTVECDMEFTAIWNVCSYTVSYFVKLDDGDPESAESEYPSATYYFDRDFELPQAAAVTGYDFVGWFANGTAVEKLAAEEYAEDITVVAKYAKKTFTVTFKNGETTVDTQTVVYGGTARSVAPDPVLGKVFVGWRNDGAAYDFSAPVTENITLDAVFEAAVYNIIYKQQLADGTPTSVTYSPNKHTFGIATALPVAKDIDGYIFVGWYVDGEAVTELGANGYFGDITAVVKYRKKPVTVTFVSEGAEYKVEYEVGQTVSPKVLLRDGYVLDGWYTDEDLTYEYKFDAAVSVDVTLYAKWSKAPAADDGKDDGDNTVLVVSIVVPIAVVICGGAAAFFVLRMRKNKKKGETETNESENDNDGKDGE